MYSFWILNASKQFCTDNLSIMQENMKLLITYIVDSFWDQLEKFENLVSIHSLKVKYEQVFSSFILSTNFLLKIKSSATTNACLQF